ncbi:MAG: CoA transferase, partial [Gammaproteobacteria bacterium]|nr:CoA transferase [Gammaproteobacteria bacterium]
MDKGTLSGILVVSLEQAVAAPFCASRLADAGARVIKVEREAGDFARNYDSAIQGESVYFVWLNRGKESLVLDIKDADDSALLERILAKTDVFIQNLAPGAAQRAGFGSAALRRRYPRLITCDISGYGEEGDYADMKAYDMLVQA